MNVNVNVNVTKEYILRRISQEDIFQRYLGIRPVIPGRFTNPLRKDENPDCYFKYDTRGVLKFIDLAKRWSWDCFNVVEVVNSCTFIQALRIVANDFELGGSNIKIDNSLRYNQEDKERYKFRIHIRVRHWCNRDFQFWKHSSKEELELAGIYALDRFWLEIRGELVQYVCGTRIRTYAYIFGRDDENDLIIKIYCPDKNIGRFYHSHTNVLQGSNTLPKSGKDFVLTKSYKDVYYIKKFGFAAAAPMSETILLTHNQYDILSSRFENLYSLMDRDKTGMHMMWLLRKYYGIQPLLIPRDLEKDFTDNLFKYGYQNMIDLIEDLNYGT